MSAQQRRSRLSVHFDPTGESRSSLRPLGLLAHGQRAAPAVRCLARGRCRASLVTIRCFVFFSTCCVLSFSLFLLESLQSWAPASPYLSLSLLFLTPHTTHTHTHTLMHFLFSPFIPSPRAQSRRRSFSLGLLFLSLSSPPFSLPPLHPHVSCCHFLLVAP